MRLLQISSAAPALCVVACWSPSSMLTHHVHGMAGVAAGRGAGVVPQPAGSRAVAGGRPAALHHHGRQCLPVVWREGRAGMYNFHTLRCTLRCASSTAAALLCMTRAAARGGNAWRETCVSLLVPAVLCAPRHRVRDPAAADERGQQELRAGVRGRGRPGEVRPEQVRNFCFHMNVSVVSTYRPPLTT